jgi:lipopolysaccharide/colanic/teichoic acid biosynthesis glycosyltransferase
MSVPKYINTYDLDSTTPSTLAGPVTTYILFKRLFDLGLIVVFSPVIIPLMLITAIIIKLESKGAVFFWQERVGVHGRVFNMLKFRSMTTDSEKEGSQFAQNGDKRVTRFGRFIRKMRIDEIPQLWNIIRGDMSLIGPRPEQVSFVKEFEKAIPLYASRHIVRPGITGLAQVEQGYVDDEEGTRTKLIYDLHYIDHLSFKMDMEIVGKTIYTMATGFGAR